MGSDSRSALITLTTTMANKSANAKTLKMCLTVLKGSFKANLSQKSWKTTENHWKNTNQKRVAKNLFHRFVQFWKFSHPSLRLGGIAPSRLNVWEPTLPERFIPASGSTLQDFSRIFNFASEASKFLFFIRWSENCNWTPHCRVADSFSAHFHSNLISDSTAYQ